MSTNVDSGIRVNSFSFVELKRIRVPLFLDYFHHFLHSTVSAICDQCLLGPRPVLPSDSRR